MTIDTHPTEEVLREVARERQRQDARWGEQNHPDGASDVYAATADHYREICQAHAAEGHCTWKDILLEEVWEAFAEPDPAKLRAELVQVAAVAAAWAEAIDRRTV